MQSLRWVPHLHHHHWHIGGQPIVLFYEDSFRPETQRSPTLSIPCSGRVGAADSGQPAEWVSGLKFTQKVGDLLETQFQCPAREGGDHSLGQVPTRAMAGLRQCVLACVPEGAGPQTITRCFKKNGPFPQIDVENLGYRKFKQICVCVCVLCSK